MSYVVCVVQDEPIEKVSVGIKDSEGNRNWVKSVEKKRVRREGNRWLFPVTIMAREKTRLLIKLPFKTEDGADRLWVNSMTVTG